MEAASIKEALNGKSNDKYITPYTLSKILSSYNKSDGGKSLSELLPIGSQIAIGTIDPTKYPSNWLVCDGRELSREAYADLFAVIGTSYGAGDGSTTFNLPDKRGRGSVGVDGTQTEFDTLGKKGGSKFMQKHNHNNSGVEGRLGGWSYGTGIDRFQLTTSNSAAGYPIIALADAGEGDSGNLQPYEVDNWIIKAYNLEVELPLEIKSVVRQDYADSYSDVYSCSYLNSAIEMVKNLIPSDSAPEIGNNNNGMYWKYPDGRLICFKEVYYSTGLSGNVFYTFPGAVIGLGNWAHAFTKAPYTTMNIQTVGSSYHSLEAVHDKSATFVGNAVIWRPSNATCTGYITAIGFGSWK